jgi:hypothetical protein
MKVVTHVVRNFVAREKAGARSMLAGEHEKLAGMKHCTVSVVANPWTTRPREPVPGPVSRPADMSVGVTS